MVVTPSSPSNSKGALSKYSVETGEPQSTPMSRKSLAVKNSGAVRGTVPLMTSLPFTVTTTSSGEIGRASFSRDFSRALKDLGVPELGLSPYSLRPSGASNDFLFKRRTAEEIKARGRWKSDTSVNKYLKRAFVFKLQQQVKIANPQNLQFLSHRSKNNNKTYLLNNQQLHHYHITNP